MSAAKAVGGDLAKRFKAVTVGYIYRWQRKQGKGESGWAAGPAHGRGKGVAPCLSNTSQKEGMQIFEKPSTPRSKKSVTAAHTEV